MTAWDEGDEQGVEDGITVTFTPAETAVGANLMALALAVMTHNEREGSRIMALIGEPHLAPIAISATTKMAAAIRGAPRPEEDA